MLYSISRVALEWNYTSRLILKKRRINEGKTVYYEQLICKPKNELEAICAYLGVEFQDEMLNYSSNLNPENIVVKSDKKYKISDEENRALHIGLTQKPNTNKINAWKHELTKEEANTTWEITSRSAIQMGYVKDESIQPIRLGAPYYLSCAHSFVRNNILISNWYKLPFFVQRSIKRVKVFMGWSYM